MLSFILLSLFFMKVDNEMYSLGTGESKLMEGMARVLSLYPTLGAGFEPHRKKGDGQKLKKLHSEETGMLSISHPTVRSIQLNAGEVAGGEKDTHLHRWP